LLSPWSRIHLSHCYSTHATQPCAPLSDPSSASLLPTGIAYFPAKLCPQLLFICSRETRHTNSKCCFKQYSSLKLTKCWHLRTKCSLLALARARPRTNALAGAGEGRQLSPEGCRLLLTGKHLGWNSYSLTYHACTQNKNGRRSCCIGQ